MDEWDALCGNLPDHGEEMLASHQGAPSIADQSASHGAPAPAEDRGLSEAEKYGSVPSAC